MRSELLRLAEIHERKLVAKRKSSDREIAHAYDEQTEAQRQARAQGRSLLNRIRFRAELSKLWRRKKRIEEEIRLMLVLQAGIYGAS